MELGDIELLAGRVDIPLAAAERHGRNAVGGEPVGVQAAVGDREFGGEAFCLDRRRRRGYARFVAAQAKRFVIEPAIESYAAARSIGTSHRGGRSFECGFDFFDDPLAEFWIVAAGFGADVHVVGHDVGRLAALMTPTLLVPSPSFFVTSPCQPPFTRSAMASDAMAIALTPSSG